MHALIVVVLIALAVVLGLCLPLNRVPLVALLSAVLIPINNLPLPIAATVLAPGAVCLSFWAIRVRRRPNSREGPQNYSAHMAVLFLVWCFLSTSWSINKLFSAGWIISIALSLLWPIIALRGRPFPAGMLAEWWVRLGCGLGLFGIVERMLGRNPLFATLYSEARFPLTQTSEFYRITTTLGHPLNNALFFSVAVVLGIGLAIETSQRRWFIVMAPALAALWFTGSRSGVVAAAAGVTVMVARRYIFVAARGMSSGGRRIVALLIVCVVVVSSLVGFTVLSKDRSYAASASTSERSQVISVAISLASEHHFVGAGPDSSNTVLTGTGGSAGQLIVESSYLELLVSVGIPGLALFLMLVFIGLKQAWKAQRLIYLGGLLTAAISIGGYNMIEGVRPLIVLVGLLMCGAVCDRDVDLGKDRRAESADRVCPAFD